MVDLRAKPYYLGDEDIAWVENTIAGMSAEEKVGQLFWQLTASQDSLFMISKGNVVFSVNTGNGKLNQFAVLPEPSSYNLGGSRRVEGYRIEAVSGQMNIYGVVRDSATLPTFTFVDSTSQIVEDSSSNYMLLSAYIIDNENTVWNLLQPAPQYSTLRKGSRGAEVRALQERLNDLGYSCGKADGVFGSNTRSALRYFQSDAGIDYDGIASIAVQKVLFSKDAPEYERYIYLSRGDVKTHHYIISFDPRDA